MIREHAAVLLALFDSKKADGTPYSYAEMLTLVGLSATHDWVRALSKFFVANGKRRKVEYTWKRDEIPASETLPGVLDEPQTTGGDFRRMDLNNTLGDALKCAYESYAHLLTLVQKDDENFRVWHFLSWSKNNDDETATALCDGNGWFWQAINCMRDGDMGHYGDDGVYDRIWWTDSVESIEEPRPATWGEVLAWERHCSYEHDPSWDYVGTFPTDEGIVAVYKKHNE